MDNSHYGFDPTYGYTLAWDVVTNVIHSLQEIVMPNTVDEP